MPKISKKRLGAKKDKFDKKAWYHERKLKATPSADLSKYRPPIKDQGNVGSCVGFALSSVLTAEANKLGVSLMEYQRFSETDIYNGGRFIDGSLPYDEGTYASSALEWLRLKYCLPYKHWQYIGFEKKSRPSDLDQYAKPYPLKSSQPLNIGYFRLVNGIEGILGALADGHMVAVGSPWPNKWMSTKDGILATPKASDSVAGGHEWYIYKSLVETEKATCGNSWGTNQWSYSGKYVDKGCFQIDFSVFDWFKSQGGYDAHIVIVDWGNPQPEPEPTPTPEPVVNLPPYVMGSNDGISWKGHKT